jgi:hypothetical protein
MNVNALFQILTGMAFVFSLSVFANKLRAFNQLARPVDLAQPKGNVQNGLIYAYTLGMAPWSKESTRRHMLSYLRGVAFHIGIFIGLAALIVSPWMQSLPAVFRMGLAILCFACAVLGLFGFLARFSDRHLKALSTKDDYFAVLLVSLFIGVTGLWIIYPGLTIFYYSISAVMLVYAPFSKIRHCIYFAYSRWFYGKFIGSRAILPHSKQEVSHG